MKKLGTRFGSAEQSPGFMLWKAANLLQRLHARSLRELEVTPTQLSVMMCLLYLAQDGPVTPTRIVDHAGIDKMMTSDAAGRRRRGRLTVLTTRRRVSTCASCCSISRGTRRPPHLQSTRTTAGASCP
jgi:hypothetical protein